MMLTGNRFQYFKEYLFGPKMSNGATSTEEDTRRLIVAISDFLRDQFIAGTDLVLEDRDYLQIAVECLELVYGLDDPTEYANLRFGRPLLDIFNQVTNPVSVRDKLRADAHKDEGNDYMTRLMFENAETEYTNAIEIDRWNPIYYCNRASSRIEQHRYFEAIADCRQALLLNPDYAKAHGRMGQAYALLRRPREAARCFRQALEIEPDNERYRNNLIIAENQIDRPDAVGLITSILNSIFGMRPRSDTNDDPNLSFPPSFMIITESHPPRTETPLQNIGHSESSNELTDTERNETVVQSNDMVYPLPYGVIDEGSEEQPVLQLDVPDTDNNINTTEFRLQLPDSSCFQSFEPPVCKCSRTSYSEESVTGDSTRSLEKDGNISSSETVSEISPSENDMAGNVCEDTYEKNGKKNGTTETSKSDSVEKVIIDYRKESPAVQTSLEAVKCRSNEKFQEEDKSVTDVLHSEITTTKKGSAECPKEDPEEATGPLVSVQDEVARGSSKDEVARDSSKDEVARDSSKDEVARDSSKDEVARDSSKDEVERHSSKDEVDDILTQDEFTDDGKRESLTVKPRIHDDKLDVPVPSETQQEIAPSAISPSNEENVDKSVPVNGKDSVATAEDEQVITKGGTKADDISDQKTNDNTISKPEESKENNTVLGNEMKDSDISDPGSNVQHEDLPVQGNEQISLAKNDQNSSSTSIRRKTIESEHELFIEVQNALSSTQVKDGSENSNEETSLDNKGKKQSAEENSNQN